jgi:Tol biopolymer transport system component
MVMGVPLAVIPRLRQLVVYAAALVALGTACSHGGQASEGHKMPTTRETESGPSGVPPGRPDGLIVFWRESPWPSIWSVRPDGSHLRWAYRTHQNAKRPTLSPDGKWIAFDGAPPGEPPLSDFEIQIVRWDGTGRATLTNGQQWSIDAQWSPDGRMLSFTRFRAHSVGENASIWTVWRDGTHLRRLASGDGARWSPDGKRIAYGPPAPEGRGRIIAIRPDGSRPVTVLETPLPAQPAAWSPDGTKLLFTEFDRSGGGDVFVVNTDGTGLRRLTKPGWPNMAAAWSPDGSEILFTRGPPGNAELLLMDADGSHERTISDDRFRGYEPSWR